MVGRPAAPPTGVARADRLSAVRPTLLRCAGPLRRTLRLVVIFERRMASDSRRHTSTLGHQIILAPGARVAAARGCLRDFAPRRFSVWRRRRCPPADRITIGDGVK